MKKNILLVDDDKIFNFLASQILKKIGLANEIKIALNGLEALEVLENSSKQPNSLPNLILLDINMPLMNGFEFLEVFTKSEISKKKEIIIAIVTSSSDERDLLKAKSFGIKYFFSKPLMEEDLTNIIKIEYSQN
jgi:CheY-like chemotaxis protein